MAEQLTLLQILTQSIPLQVGLAASIPSGFQLADWQQNIITGLGYSPLVEVDNFSEEGSSFCWKTFTAVFPVNNSDYSITPAAYFTMTSDGSDVLITQGALDGNWTVCYANNPNTLNLQIFVCGSYSELNPTVVI